MKYRLRRSVGVPADVAGVELQRINAEHGKITPEILLEEARADDAPLHAAFTWDNEKAGDSFRLIEARNLIRSVHVVDEDGEDRGCVFAHVAMIEDDEGGAYLPVAEIVQDPSKLTSALQGLARKQNEASRALADLEREARRLGKRKQVAGIGRARKATDVAAAELRAIA